MERKIDRVLQNWFEDRDHKALVLRGPRQVGKSYAIRKGYKVHFYRNPIRRMELDFVFDYNGELAVVEVESGRKKSARSLNKALSEDKAIDIAMKVSDSNISTDENGVRHYPLFGPSFFEDRAVLELPPLTGIDELKTALDRGPL